MSRMCEFAQAFLSGPPVRGFPVSDDTLECAPPSYSLVVDAADSRDPSYPDTQLQYYWRCGYSINVLDDQSSESCVEFMLASATNLRRCDSIFCACGVREMHR